jgi:hypothetical protein
MENAHETIVVNFFGTFIRVYELFRSQRLNANVKLTKEHIISIIISASAAQKFAAATYLLKFQRLYNKILRTTCNLTRCTSTVKLHVAFKINETQAGSKQTS